MLRVPDRETHARTHSQTTPHSCTLAWWEMGGCGCERKGERRQAGGHTVQLRHMSSPVTMRARYCNVSSWFSEVIKETRRWMETFNHLDEKNTVCSWRCQSYWDMTVLLYGECMSNWFGCLWSTAVLFQFILYHYYRPTIYRIFYNSYK